MKKVTIQSIMFEYHNEYVDNNTSHDHNKLTINR